jgi:hypothetical protein
MTRRPHLDFEARITQRNFLPSNFWKIEGSRQLFDPVWLWFWRAHIPK